MGNCTSGPYLAPYTPFIGILAVDAFKQETPLEVTTTTDTDTVQEPGDLDISVSAI